jgi:jumonji domain-containing protein 7
MHPEPETHPTFSNVELDRLQPQRSRHHTSKRDAAIEKSHVLNILRSVSVNLRELDLGLSIATFPTLSCTAFLRDFVATNKPVVLTMSEARTWQAVSSWSDPDYLVQKAGNSPVTVALTPDGRADCPGWCRCNNVAVPCFALPYEYETTLSTFFYLLKRANEGDNSKVNLIPYMQYQNSSLTLQLPALLGDVPSEIPWANEAFGSAPEAVNIWIGGKRSATSWHRDHYENIYVVIVGSKTFRMRPPADAYAMKLRKYPVARWQRPPDDPLPANSLPTSLFLSLLDLHTGPQVVWSSILPSSGCMDQQETLPGAPSALEVTVKAGEMIYLPSGWWHEVYHEDDFVVAVNYWYDMKFDVKYAYTKGIEALAAAIGLNETLEEP